MGATPLYGGGNLNLKLPLLNPPLYQGEEAIPRFVIQSRIVILLSASESFGGSCEIDIVVKIVKKKIENGLGKWKLERSKFLFSIL